VLISRPLAKVTTKVRRWQARWEILQKELWDHSVIESGNDAARSGQAVPDACLILTDSGMIEDPKKMNGMTYAITYGFHPSIVMALQAYPAPTQTLDWRWSMMTFLGRDGHQAHPFSKVFEDASTLISPTLGNVGTASDNMSALKSLENLSEFMLEESFVKLLQPMKGVTLGPKRPPRARTKTASFQEEHSFPFIS
jgi:hypothetical protein